MNFVSNNSQKLFIISKLVQSFGIIKKILYVIWCNIYPDIFLNDQIIFFSIYVLYNRTLIYERVQTYVRMYKTYKTYQRKIPKERLLNEFRKTLFSYLAYSYFLIYSLTYVCMCKESYDLSELEEHATWGKNRILQILGFSKLRTFILLIFFKIQSLIIKYVRHDCRHKNLLCVREKLVLHRFFQLSR